MPMVYWEDRMNWGKSHTNLCLIAAALFLGACDSGAIFLAKPGTTTGVVTLNSAQVYSRERLLNDRNREVAWLRGQLGKSDLAIFGFQGRSDISTVRARLSETQITTDVKKGSITRPGTGAVTKGTGSEPDKAAPFKSPAGTDLSDKFLGANKPLLQRPDIGTTSANVSPVDGFRDHVAFREEIRAQLIETQLDDRHDLKGKTLYRLQMSPAVLPGHDTDSWAILKVRVNPPKIEKDWLDGLYTLWANHQRKALNQQLVGLVEGIVTGKVNTQIDLDLVIWFLDRARKECEAFRGDSRILSPTFTTDVKSNSKDRSARQSIVSNSLNAILDAWVKCRRSTNAELLQTHPNKSEYRRPDSDDSKQIRAWLIAGTAATFVTCLSA